MNGWMSKERVGVAPSQFGAAHFLIDGVPHCATIVLSDGLPLRQPFKCTWVPLREFDHLCRECRAADPSRPPRPCRCATCGVLARSR